MPLHLEAPSTPARSRAPTRIAPRGVTRTVVQLPPRLEPLVALEKALGDALDGYARSALIVGEAGIGKTSLLQRLALSARARGAQVLMTRCSGDEPVPMYWPWVQALRALRERGADFDGARVNGGVQELAVLLPELRRSFPVSDMPTPHATVARLRLFDAVAKLLDVASRRNPLVLVIDDVHAADAPSLALLQFVTDQLLGSRVLSACAYRGEALRRRRAPGEVLAQIARNPACERIDL